MGGVIEQYTRFVKPAFDQYVAPSRKHADVIIPWARCVGSPPLPPPLLLLPLPPLLHVLPSSCGGGGQHASFQAGPAVARRAASASASS